MTGHVVRQEAASFPYMTGRFSLNKPHISICFFEKRGVKFTQISYVNNLDVIERAYASFWRFSGK